MKSKKKIAAMALSCVMAGMSLVGCGDGSNGADGKVYNIGICQLVEHAALDAATEGFKAALSEKLDKNVKFYEQNAQGEATNCATICNGFVSSGYDLIFGNATGALQAAAAATNTIPIVGTSVTDYATALDMDNWTLLKLRLGSGMNEMSDMPSEEREKPSREFMASSSFFLYHAVMFFTYDASLRRPSILNDVTPASIISPK